MMDVISVRRKRTTSFRYSYNKHLKASNKGTIRIATAKADPFASKSNLSYMIFDSTILMAKTDNKKPMTNEPVSPINIFAGWKLNLRKAKRAPVKDQDRTTYSKSLLIKNKSPKRKS